MKIVRGHTSLLLAIAVAVAFSAGLLSHALYRRWTEAPANAGYEVTFVPSPPPAPPATEIPKLSASDVRKIRELAGTQASIRGRVYRVGHSNKSNTYFLNFGPSRSSLTAVIFASALPRFEQRKIDPKSYEGKEVELFGEIRDHPQYGLEVVLEDPSQIRVVN